MPSVPPMDDARTTPRMTQQMMIMIFFCGATTENRAVVKDVKSLNTWM